MWGLYVSSRYNTTLRQYGEFDIPELRDVTLGILFRNSLLL